MKTAIKGSFRPIGVPPTAQFRGYAYIGSSQNEHSGIKVQQWYNHSDTGVCERACMRACACVCACVRACVRACVCVCVHACVSMP